MRRSLFLYLFIIAALMNVFTYAYFSKAVEVSNHELVTTNKSLKDSLNTAMIKLAEANYFSLESDQNAQNYLAAENSPTTKSHEELVPYIVEQLQDYNNNPEGNPYTGQSKIADKKFIINKAKVLNHRWIVADFTDGEYWGGALIKYFINPDESLSFEVINSFIYQK